MSERGTRWKKQHKEESDKTRIKGSCNAETGREGTDWKKRAVRDGRGRGRRGGLEGGRDAMMRWR